MINRFLLGDFKCRPNAVAFTATIKAHSAAINAISSLRNADETYKKEKIQSAARRCEDLLQQLCLLRNGQGNDRSLQPTSVTFDLVLAALEQAEDFDGIKRLQTLRSEENDVEKAPKF